MSQSRKFTVSVIFLLISILLMIIFTCIVVDSVMQVPKRIAVKIVLCMILGSVCLGCTYGLLAISSHYYERRKLERIQMQMANRTWDCRTTRAFVRSYPAFNTIGSWDHYEQSLDCTRQALGEELK